MHASSHPSRQLSSVMNRPERFNAKARRSSSTTSSHKRGKQRRLKRHSVSDTNPEILPRKSTEEKELDRREQLKKEVSVYLLHAAPSDPMQLLSQSQSKASSKKRKRLDKYIVRTLYLLRHHAECLYQFSGEKAEEGRACRAIRKTCVGRPLLASISFTDSWMK